MSSWALPLAAAGELPDSFFHERTSDTLPCQATDKLFCFDWAREHIDRYETPTLQHLKLVVLAVLIGFAIAFTLALLAHRRRWLQPPLLAATGVLYTIPSVAFFFLLLPLTGRGVDTAVIALTAFNLQVIYRNTIVGLANVPSSVKDAARGMGQTERQILWRVELPLATPEIIAGLRIATVSTVAIATLATLGRRRRARGADLLGRDQLQDQHHHRRRDRDPDGAHLRRDPASRSSAWSTPWERVARA